MSPPKTYTTKEGPEKDVRKRIIDAAEELFARKGYAKTSIRRITKHAGCNLSAVNYYFHGKKNLYIEVYRRHMHAIRNKRINSIRKVLSKQEGQMDLEELLKSFAVAFLESFGEGGSGLRLMALMMRERNEPNLPKQLFIDEVVLPVKNIMKDALMQICPGLRDKEADLCVHSIVGQLIHVLQTRDLFKGIDKVDVHIIDLSVAIPHIVKFSLGGIQKYSKIEPE